MSVGTHLARALVKHRLSHVFSPTQTVEDDRRVLAQLSVLLPLARGTRVTRDRISGMDAEWIDARRGEDTCERLILYLHGGGFSSGSCDTHRALASHLSRAAGARVLLPEYALAPEHPHPAAERDCMAVYRQLLDRGVEPRRLIVAGDSAGGFLTLQTLLSARKAGLPMPAAAVLWSALTDAVHLDGESYRTCADADVWFDPERIDATLERYAGPRELRDASLSPLNADLHGLPPLRIDVGAAEVLRSDSERLASRIREAGGEAELKVWPGMWHVFMAFGLLVAEARHCLQEAGLFCRRHTCADTEPGGS